MFVYHNINLYCLFLLAHKHKGLSWSHFFLWKLRGRSCVSVKWLVLTNWLLGCSTSLSLSLCMRGSGSGSGDSIELSRDPRSHNPARDFGDSISIMTFMTGVRNIIHPPDTLEVRVIRGSVETNEVGDCISWDWCPEWHSAPCQRHAWTLPAHLWVAPCL